MSQAMRDYLDGRITSAEYFARVRADIDAEMAAYWRTVIEVERAPWNTPRRWWHRFRLRGGAG